MFTTFFTSHHYKPFTFHYQTSKHYLRNNIPVFESIHSMLNLLSTKNKALLLTTFQIPGINMQNIHTQKVKKLYLVQTAVSYLTFLFSQKLASRQTAFMAMRKDKTSLIYGTCSL